MKLIIPPRPGRPPTHPIDRLRTRMWFHALSSHTGLQASELEKRLDPEKIHIDETGRPVRPRKWDRYEEGKLVPDDKVDGAVDRAESLLFGSSKWFRHPLWSGLHEPQMTEAETMDGLKKLDQSVLNVLFRCRSDMAPEVWSQYGPMINTERTVIAELSRLATLDVLAVALLLAKRAQAIASPELRDAAADLYFEMQAVFAGDSLWAVFHPELFDFADTRLKCWAFVDPAHRMDIFIPWRGARSDAWPEQSRWLSEAIEEASGRATYGLTEEDKVNFPT